MAIGSDANNITKKDVADFMNKNVKRQDMEYVINALVNTTLYGWEYPSEERHGRLEMSYYCRAYNITECGVSKQRNRIKGRYKKYAQVQGIENYMRQILKKYWPGFPSEQPRMDELLASFVNNPGQQSTTSQQGVNWQPTSQRTYQDNISQGWSNSGNIGNVSPEENQKNDSNDWISGVVGFVVLMLIIVFCLKSCGATSGVGDSLWTAIKTFFIRALKFVGIVFGVGFPICWFVMNKGWKRLKAALVGAIFFLLSGSFFSVGGLYGVIFGVMFWIGGIAIWNDEQIPKK